MVNAYERQNFKHKLRARKRSTQAEKRALRILEAENKQYKFQIIVGFFIVDIVLPEKMLVIEVDGGYHDTPRQIWYDNQRDKFLRACGFNVLHIRNENIETLPELLATYPNLPDSEKRMGKALSAGNVLKDKLTRQKAKREEMARLGQTRLI